VGYLNRRLQLFALAWVLACGDGAVSSDPLGTLEQANSRAAEMHGVSQVHRYRLDDGTLLRGRGIVLGQLEHCRPDEHPDFRDGSGQTRVHALEANGCHRWNEAGEWILDPAGISDHATHTAGTMIGNGEGDPRALGMAPEATLWAGVDGQFDLVAAARDHHVAAFSRTAGAPVNKGLCNFPYNASAARLDEVVIRSGALVLQSSGNRGFGEDERFYCPGGWHSLNEEGSAKNILVVGASTKGDGSSRCARASTDPFHVAVDSSRGPTRDGRIKPDIVAEYWLWSTTVDGGYVHKNGTSMSTPLVTGVVALVHQKYLARFQTRPSPSMVRAVLLHSATDLGTPGPDYCHGWGAVNAVDAIDLLDAPESGRHLEEVELGPGSVHRYFFEAKDASEVRATIAWTDPVASFNPPPAIDLVNDVDLWLESPSGTVHLPFVMPYAASCGPSGSTCQEERITEAARRGRNDRDNVEQVVVPSPEPGMWMLVVKGTALSKPPQTVSIAVSVRPRPTFTPDPAYGPTFDAGCGVGGESMVPAALLLLGLLWRRR